MTLSNDQAKNLELRAAIRAINTNVSWNAINREDVGYDIIVAWGASNTVGYGSPIIPEYDFNSPRVLQLETSGSLGVTIAKEPLQHYEVRTNNIGAVHKIGKLITNLRPNNRTLLILPRALGGAGFAENRWNPGNDLYNQTVAAVNATLAENPNNRVLFFFNCLHGGQDKDMATEAYKSAWRAFINGIRGSIVRHPNLLFITAGYPDSSVNLDGGVRGQKQVIVRDQLIPEFRNWLWVNTAGLGNDADNLHFSAAGQRLLAERAELVYRNWAIAQQKSAIL